MRSFGVTLVLLLLVLTGSSPVQGLTGSVQAAEACERDAATTVTLPRPWRGPVEDGALACLRIDLDEGQLARLAVELRAAGQFAGLRLAMEPPEPSATALEVGLEVLEFGESRRTLSWRAESPGPHLLSIEGALGDSEVRVWIEAVEPPALQRARQRAIVADPRAAELAERAHPLRSIDPSDEDFADLAPLRQMLEGVRVVLLGEATHRAASDFWARSRLVKFLHRELGFDVLAFEAGLHSVHRAREALLSANAPRTPAREAFALGLWPFWTHAEQMQPLLEYVAESLETDRPLEPVGFDSQGSGAADAEFGRDLTRFLDQHGIEGPFAEGSRERDALESLGAIRRAVWAGRREEAPLPDARARVRFFQALEETRRRLAAVPDDDARLWERLVQNAGVHARLVFLEAEGRAGYGAGRDRQMADNLLWLAEERFPGRKIIAWAATAHVMRKPGLPAHGLGAEGMGDHLRAAFGEESFAIGTTSLEGRREEEGRSVAFIVPDQHPLAEFEELMGAAGLEHALVDLRGAAREGSWLGGSFHARPVGWTVDERVWSERLDAILFLRSQQPFRRVADQAPGANIR